MPVLVQSRGCPGLRKGETLMDNADFTRGSNSTGEAKHYLGELQIKPSQEAFLASHE